MVVGWTDALTVWMAAGSATMLATPVIRSAAIRLKIVDRPGPRKVHQQLLPRAGGVAVLFGWLVGLMIAVQMPEGVEASRDLMRVTLLACLVVAFGLIDDRKDLPGRIKLVAQFAIGSLAYLWGFRIDRLSNPFGGELLFPQMLSYLVTVAWVVGMMNALNLIDGLDGLACGIAAITALALVCAGLYVGSSTAVLVLAALAGACIGFLWHNFFPARIFLGDSGSQLLGFVFAVAPLIESQYKTATAAALLIPLMALSLPIYDTALAILRRFRGRRSIFRGDRYHLHHRLLRIGLTHRQVVLFLYLVSAYLASMSFLLVLLRDRYALVLLILLALGLLMAMQTLRFIEYTLRRRYRQSRHRAE